MKAIGEPERQASEEVNSDLGSPIFPSGCKGKLGVALESLQCRTGSLS